MNTGDKMKFCPKCGSTNIEWVLPQIWSKWECRDLEKNILKNKKRFKAKRKKS
jgi:hypothetical protein